MQWAKASIPVAAVKWGGRDNVNFGSSIISLFYGEGSFKETIKIATLCGWDSDNPASTWAGLLGFIYGKKEIEKMFDEELSTRYNIGRTRIGFENEIDDFKKKEIIG